MPSASAKLTCSHVWKVFGQGAAKMMKDADFASLATREKRARLDEAGMITGAEDVSFSVKTGELFVIMGLSGSGKSTVLRCIAQLQGVSAGEITLDDTRLDNMPASALREIRRRKMGMVFQNFGLVPHFTALENIAFPLKVRGESSEAVAAKANEMLDLVGLEGRGDSYPSELSGGQQQRVGIARSLAVDPEVWLLDEPFSALDPLIRRQLQDELLELQGRLKKTIIFITHDFAEAVKLADRIAIMRDGRIVQQGTPADLLLKPKDDYVKSFVSDVSRMHVLQLFDVMKKAGARARGKGVITMNADARLEECLVEVGKGARVISAQCPQTGKIVGQLAGKDLLAIAGS